jgi:hypothetical protein
VRRARLASGSRISSDGSGRLSFGWTIARNALARMKPGDHIFVTLRGSRVARLGTLTQLAVEDSEWRPFIPPSPTEKYGEKGRRIHVKWDLELGPDDREYVVALPPGIRLSGAQLRTTLSVVKSPSLAQLRAILADQTNWVQDLGTSDLHTATAACADYSLDLRLRRSKLKRVRQAWTDRIDWAPRTE